MRRAVIVVAVFGLSLASVQTALASAPSNAELRLTRGVVRLTADGSGIAPAVLTWTQGSSATAGVSCCTNDISDVNGNLLAETTGTSWPTALTSGDGYAYRIDSYDANGTYVGTAFTDPPTYFDGFYLADVMPGYGTYTGRWREQHLAGALGGLVEYSTRRGATATFAFGGRAIELVMDKGPRYGRARITLRAGSQTTTTKIDLHARRFRERRVMFARNYPESTADVSGTISITNLGTRGHPKVDINAVGGIETD
jgi:hypothetical protein